MCLAPGIQRILLVAYLRSYDRRKTTKLFYHGEPLKIGFCTALLSPPASAILLFQPRAMESFESALKIFCHLIRERSKCESLQQYFERHEVDVGF